MNKFIYNIRISLIVFVMFFLFFVLPKTIFAETITFSLTGQAYNSAWSGRSSTVSTSNASDSVVGNEVDFISGGSLGYLAPSLNKSTFTTDFKLGLQICEVSGSNCTMGWTGWASDLANQGSFNIYSALALLISSNPSHDRLHYVTTYLQTRPLPNGSPSSLVVQVGTRISEMDYIIPNTNWDGTIMPENFTSYCGGTFSPVGGGMGAYMGALDRNAGATCGKSPSADPDVIMLTMNASWAPTPNAVPVSDNIPTSFNNSELKNGPFNIVMKNTGNTTWTSDLKSVVSSSGTCTLDTDGDGTPDAPATLPRNLGQSCVVTYKYSSSQFKLRHTASSFAVNSEDAAYSQTVNVTNEVISFPGETQCDSEGLQQQLRAAFITPSFNWLSWLVPKAEAMAKTPPGCTTTPTIYDYDTTYDVYPNVLPGGTATFNISSIKAPATSGTPTETWKMVGPSGLFGSPFSKAITVGSGALMTGTLTVGDSPCSIQVNANSCQVHATWEVKNQEVVGGSAITSPVDNSGSSTNSSGVSYSTIGGFTVDTGDKITNYAIDVPYTASPRTLYLFNNSKSLVPTVESPNGSGLKVSAICTSGTGWNGSKCLAAGSYPDLTADVVPQTGATKNVPINFTTNITNNGNASTGTSFHNFFQVATAINGGGTISDITPATPDPMPALNVGANAMATSPAYTFSSTGTYSVRACADKTNSGSSGSILESNEANNCGIWQNVIVGASGTWNPGPCVPTSGYCGAGTQTGICSDPINGCTGVAPTQACVLSCTTTDGACSSPAKHYNCSPASVTATNQKNNPSKWTWTCPGNSGGVDASCSEKHSPGYIEN